MFIALRRFRVQLDHLYGGGSAVGKRVRDRSWEDVVADPGISCQSKQPESESYWRRNKKACSTCIPFTA